MTDVRNKFSNVIFCDDIRDEAGNKKSLMGVLGGDILVESLPATIQLAIYAEFAPETKDTPLQIAFRLLIDDDEIAKGSIAVRLPSSSHVATLVLPKGMVTFDRESAFRLLASIDGSPESEIGAKKILLQKPLKV